MKRTRDMGFRVYSSIENRYLRPEEIDAANLYMTHDGKLVRFEPFMKVVGEGVAAVAHAVPYVCEARDLVILPLWKRADGNESKENGN